MQRQIYPSEYAEDSIERHLAQYPRRSPAVYLSVVALLIGGLASLPLIRVDVSVRSPGIIRPTTEKHVLAARASGFAQRVHVDEGDLVERGAVLFELRDGRLDERESLLLSRAAQLERTVHDLELLTTAGQEADRERFRTPERLQELAQLRQELSENALVEEQAARELARVRTLAEQNLASVQEVETRQFELSRARSDRELIVERFQTRWQSDLTGARLELDEVRTELAQLGEERALYRITAPVTGTVEELAPVSPGSYVAAGHELAVISPSSELVAETFVEPKDIGLIRTQSPVRMQIDAFNYNEWGFVTGRVEDIADDFVMLNQRPIFRVRIALDQTHLSLRNGVRGQLKKGMTLQARFLVTRRSLLQLLRDDVNDWLNPAAA